VPRPAGWPRWAGAWHNALVAHVGPWPQAVVPDEIKGHQTYMNLTGAFSRTKVYCLSTGLRNTAIFFLVVWRGPSLSVFLDGFLTPPELSPFPSGGVRIGEQRAPQKTSELSPLRGRYARKGDLFIPREVNDEARPDHCRDPGHFGFHRLGRGGKCTIWRSGPRPCASLRPRASLRPCASLWPFSKICPSSLPALCSSDLSRSDLWRSRRSPFDVCR
jgi:hypothetical protein